MTIGCGCTDPDPKVEAKVVAARTTLHVPSGFDGCGRLMVVWSSYRCLECGRFMHADCLRRHFHASRHDRVQIPIPQRPPEPPADWDPAAR